MKIILHLLHGLTINDTLTINVSKMGPWKLVCASIISICFRKRNADRYDLCACTRGGWGSYVVILNRARSKIQTEPEVTGKFFSPAVKMGCSSYIFRVFSVHDRYS